MVFFLSAGTEIWKSVSHKIIIQYSLYFTTLYFKTTLDYNIAWFVPKGQFSVLNDLYFKTICNIRPQFLGPMGGLKMEGPLYLQRIDMEVAKLWYLLQSKRSLKVASVYHNCEVFSLVRLLSTENLVLVVLCSGRNCWGGLIWRTDGPKVRFHIWLLIDFFLFSHSIHFQVLYHCFNTCTAVPAICDLCIWEFLPF